MILLDTNVLVEILEKRSRKGEALYSYLINTGESICTTVLNLHELLYGLKKYNKPTNTILQLPIINYTKDDALLSAEIDYRMEKIGTTVRRTDSMIASVAINKSIPLLTFDQRHFIPIAEKFPLNLFSKIS